MANRFLRLIEHDDITGAALFTIIDATDGGHVYTLHDEVESGAVVSMLNRTYMEGWRKGVETAREIMTTAAPQRVAEFDLHAAISFLTSLPSVK